MIKKAFIDVMLYYVGLGLLGAGAIYTGNPHGAFIIMGVGMLFHVFVRIVSRSPE